MSKYCKDSFTDSFGHLEKYTNSRLSRRNGEAHIANTTFEVSNVLEILIIFRDLTSCVLKKKRQTGASMRFLFPEISKYSN